MFKTSYLTTKPSLFTKDKVANQVSDLKKLQEIAKQNQETIENQIVVLSEMHDLSKNEVEHIFNEQIKLRIQKTNVRSYVITRSKKYGRKGINFFWFLLALLFVMYLILLYRNVI